MNDTQIGIIPKEKSPKRILTILLSICILATMTIASAAIANADSTRTSIMTDRKNYLSTDDMVLNIDLQGNGPVDIYIALLSSENYISTLNPFLNFNAPGIVEPLVGSIPLALISGEYAFPVSLLPTWAGGDYSIYIILTPPGESLLNGQWLESDSANFVVKSAKDAFLVKADQPPDFNAATFSNPTRITNTFLSLVPGTIKIYQSESEEGVETIVTEVLETTRTVNGVESVVFRDRVYLEDLIIEDTLDWFAQDDGGNVWYLGEEVVNYEYDDEDKLMETNSDGSWEAGIEGALAGIIMWGTIPEIGKAYYQEFLKGEAEDMGMVVKTGVTIELESGMPYENCIKTLDWTPLEPDVFEYKFYAPGVGFIKEQKVVESEKLELIGMFSTGEEQVADFNSGNFSTPTWIDNPYMPLTPGNRYTYEAETEEGVEVIVTEVLETTRMVNGVEAVVFRDRVYLNNIIVEDTYDWFAQDDSGNVWYLGEEVVNYEYDDDNNLIGTNSGGSWEAGIDGAQAGIQMWAVIPGEGNSYYQEFFKGEAEDMAMVVAKGVTLELNDGTIYENCLKTLDWTPLEQTGLEYKYYAPGIGFVKEEKLGEDMELELIDIDNIYLD